MHLVALFTIVCWLCMVVVDRNIFVSRIPVMGM
jgi:hypothetical protein